MTPTFVQRSGSEPDDVYGITLDGLLACARAAEVESACLGLLQFLRDKFEADPDFRYFTSRELAAGARGPSDPTENLHFFIALIRVIALAKVGGRGSGNPENYVWQVPPDIESLIVIRTIADFVAHVARRGAATRATDDLALTTSVAPKLDDSKQVARTDAADEARLPHPRLRPDETWHRLLEWTYGQPPSERLAAQILLSEGYVDLDPSHPLGGRDGGKDALCAKAGKKWIMAAYFPRGKQSMSTIRTKLLGDLRGVSANAADALAFVTNQALTVGERDTLKEAAGGVHVEIYHLDRIATLLDQPKMALVRSQFLSIDFGATNTEDRPSSHTPPRRMQDGAGGAAESPHAAWLPPASSWTAKDAAVVPSTSWRVRLETSLAVERTKAELHEALSSAIVRYDLRNSDAPLAGRVLSFSPRRCSALCLTDRCSGRSSTQRKPAATQATSKWRCRTMAR